jgi:hypothetical protein
MPATKSTNGYDGRAKKLHLPKSREPLEVTCLRDGSLDVCLETGIAFSVHPRTGLRIKRRTRIDKDGYVTFVLAREKSS